MPPLSIHIKSCMQTMEIPVFSRPKQSKSQNYKTKITINFCFDIIRSALRTLTNPLTHSVTVEPSGTFVPPSREIAPVCSRGYHRVARQCLFQCNPHCSGHITVHIHWKVWAIPHLSLTCYRVTRMYFAIQESSEGPQIMV
jgi:hypothetical protein